jgi:hypothetical protein
VPEPGAYRECHRGAIIFETDFRELAAMRSGVRAPLGPRAGRRRQRGCTPQPSNGASARSSPIPCVGRGQVSTRRVASSKRTTNAVLGPRIGIGKRRRRTTGSLARSIPFASATCRARCTAALRDESRPPTYLNSKLSIGPNTIASGARLLTASSVGYKSTHALARSPRRNLVTRDDRVSCRRLARSRR